MHEFDRAFCQDRDVMSDVYDADRWQERIGGRASRQLRVVLQYCVDSFPSFNRKGSHSVKPAQFLVLSLPPWLRYQTRHMLIHMLVPNKLKGQAAKKYYDFAAKFEMNELYSVGIDGVRVFVYGETNDAPGRRELLNMESVSAFYPCPHCLHTAAVGLRAQVYGSFRRFLPLHSTWRQKSFVYLGQTYMFRDVETRARPTARTDANVSTMVSLAGEQRPFCGHKGFSMLHLWDGVDWEASCCDVMHDVKTFTDMLLRALVGTGTAGMYKGWNKDHLHRRDCEVFGMFPDFCRGDAPPPWRLTKDDLHIADTRVRSMWWPHYQDLLFKESGSFWINSDTMFKCSHKRYILMVLIPTCLHGLSVKAVHNALLLLVHALRKLEGQTISVKEAMRLGVIPGSRVIKKSSIPGYDREVIAGLVLLEGSFPEDHLNPNCHHIVHYGGQTGRVGILAWLSMFVFERNNKRMKGLVRSRGKPLGSLANNIQLDIATTVDSAEFSISAPPTCAFSVCKGGTCLLSTRERVDLGILGVTSFRGVRAYKVARILGVHFRSGEWGHRRCGSVITFMHEGISRYCVVEKFLRVQGKSFARVTWLSKPHYPHAPIKLVATVRMLSPDRQRIHSCVIDVDRIEPTSVGVIPAADRVRFFMLRAHGHDRP